jgi:general secretion pathway protein G
MAYEACWCGCTSRVRQLRAPASGLLRARLPAGRADSLGGAPGFSLLELVVIIAILAALAGALMPAFRTETESARQQRAVAEVTSIAQALLTFQRTMGGWPTRDGSGTDERVHVLLSGMTLPPANPWAGPNQFWQVAVSPQGDLLCNHLVDNRPQGQAAAAYGASGTAAWRGPYLDSSPADPWGRPYVANVIAGYSTDATLHRRFWVLSAGADGMFQTSAEAKRTDGVGGDDVGILVAER